MTNLLEEIKLTVTGIFVPLFIGICFFTIMKIEKSKGEKIVIKLRLRRLIT